MKSTKKQLDLANGNIHKLVIRTAIPMVIAQIVSMLYNIVDRIFVGRIPDIGSVALGGIGIYLPISILFMAVSLLFGGGGAPKAAIALGAGNRDEAEKYLGCCVIPLIVSSVLFSICIYLWGEQILPLFGATDTNLTYTLEYVKIICLGIPFSMLSTGLNIFINTQGKTLFGMISVVLGAIINIILDAVFILGFNMGIAGAAWATVIGQIVSGIWVFGYLCSKRSAIRIRKHNLIPKIKILWDIVTLGISNFITTGAESVVSVILNNSLKKYGALALTGFSIDGGTLAITVGTIVTATSSFIRLPINGFSQGLQPVISYNYGAGKHDRVKEAIRFAMIVTTFYAAALWIFLMAVPGTFSQMFTDNIEVVNVSKNLIRIYILGMILSGIQSTFVQAFIARGMKSHSLIVSLFCKGMYIPLLLILPVLAPVKYGIVAIYSAQVITDVLAVIFSAVLYKKASKINHNNLLKSS